MQLTELSIMLSCISEKHWIFSLILPKSESLGNHSTFLFMEIGSYLVKAC